MLTAFAKSINLRVSVQLNSQGKNKNEIVIIQDESIHESILLFLDFSFPHFSFLPLLKKKN